MTGHSCKSTVPSKTSPSYNVNQSVHGPYLGFRVTLCVACIETDRDRVTLGVRECDGGRDGVLVIVADRVVVRVDVCVTVRRWVGEFVMVGDRERVRDGESVVAGVVDEEGDCDA